MVALCMFASFMPASVGNMRVLFKSALIWMMPAPGSAK
jgi:hypothetical protein